MSEAVKKAFKTGLLTPISLERGEFTLKHTGFIVTIRRDGAIWKKKVVGRAPGPHKVDKSTAVGRKALRNSARASIRYVTIPFEEVFDECPDYIRNELIYHMDVFNKKMQYTSLSPNSNGVPVPKSLDRIIYSGTKIRGGADFDTFLDETRNMSTKDFLDLFDEELDDE